LNSFDLYHFDMSIFAELLVSFLIAFLSCVAVIQLLLQPRFSRLIVDRPNHRSLHSLTIPRTGGLGLAFGTLFSIACQHLVGFGSWAAVAQTIIVYMLLLGISLVDDVRPLPALFRLAAHLLLVLFWLTSQNSGSWYVTVIFLLGITWAMNLYNFMDGSDGLAGGITFTTFFAYFLATLLANDLSIAFLSLSVGGSALGFLCFNWPPAKLFLGDAGAVPIGFLAAAIGTIGVVKGYWHPSFPLMLFAMFWIDASYTLARRAFRGEKVWQAHNEHWYQKAIRAGNTHRKILLIHLTCNTVIACLALLSTLSPTFATPLVHILTIGVVIAIAFGFGVWAESQFRGFQAKQIK
jgi:UDP-N-acetylmuramyl pentapeptide phosphotransferase/UDP-N-acetylglucosamine-1-phosphate transferase